MRTIKILNRKVSIVVGGLVLLVTLLCILWILLFGVHIEFLLPQKLRQANQLWNSQNIQHYEEVFQVGGFCGFPCSSEMKIEVQNNKIMSAESRGSLIALTSSNAAYAPVSPELMASGHLERYTIDGLFQQASEAVSAWFPIEIRTGGDSLYLLDFDPATGYISQFQINDCGTGGLLGPSISDCLWMVTVKSVRSLN